MKKLNKHVSVSLQTIYILSILWKTCTKVVLSAQQAAAQVVGEGSCLRLAALKDALFARAFAFSLKTS